MTARLLGKARLSTLIGMVALAGAVAVSGLPSREPGNVFGYRYPRYNRRSYASYIRACKRSYCAEARTCAVCARRDVTEAVVTCRATYTSAKAECTDRACVTSARFLLRTCRSDAKAQLRSALGICRQGGRQCGHCCNSTRGQGECAGYFDGSRHAGSYNYNGNIYCPGSPSGAFLSQLRTIVDRVVARLSLNPSTG